MQKLIQRFCTDQGGATAIEYGLIAGLIALVVIGGMGAAFSAIAGKFNVASNAVSAS
jgi:pilus assembly protein Flp/PilA